MSVEVRLILDDDQLAAIRDALPAAEQPDAEAWPEWMGLQRAAAYLDVSPERLAKAKQRGSVPHYQEGPGCRVFFRRSELDAWMTGLRRGGDAQTDAIP